MSSTGTVDAAEIAKFEAMAAEWWDPAGKFRPLHAMNPCRLGYIVEQVAAEFGRDRRARSPFAGLDIADIGCGGGLVAEPMARLGATVAGFDAATESLGVARAHAAAVGLEIDYLNETAEDAAARGARFDVVLALEVVEHVANIPAFLGALSTLLRPGGMVILSTLNRTPESYAAAILGAERLLRWLPTGTHDWRKFPTPEELETALVDAGLEVVDAKGMLPDLGRGGWRIGESLRVNYIMAALKPA